jgi:hypothetical protein
MAGRSQSGALLKQGFAPRPFTFRERDSGQDRRILCHRCVLHECEDKAVCWLRIVGM